MQIREALLMKRWFSALMIFVMMFSFCNVEALADTMKLPSQLKKIDSQAFYGDTSLDVVELPYGTETINSKAFAYSSLKEIYIPSTVTYIADNAFDGAPDVVIYAPEGSYAKEYAETNDFLCLEPGSIYRKEQFQELIDFINENNVDDPFYIEPFEFVPLEIDETMSEEEKDDIVKYNTLSESLQDDTNDFIESIYSLSENLNDISSELDSFSMDVVGNSVTLNGDSFNYQVNGENLENLGPDYNIKSILVSDSGDKLSVEIESNGQFYYLEADGTGISLTGTPVISRNDLKSVNAYSFQKKSFNPSSIFDTLKEKLTSFETFCSVYDRNIVNTVEKARKEKETAFAIWKLMGHYVDNGDERYMPRLKKAAKQYEEAAKNFRKVSNVQKIWNKFNVVLTIKSIMTNYQHVKELTEILNHNHPNATEASNPNLVSLIGKMKEDITTSISAYVCDSLNSCLTFMSEISAALIAVAALFPASAPVILAQRVAAMAAITTVRAILFNIFGGVILSSIADAKYNAVKEADKKLHGVITGKVTDEDTGMPIKNVSVSSGEYTVYTNSSGFYSIKSKAGANTLVFSKHGYNTKSVLVDAASQTSSVHDEKLSTRGTVAGHVYDAVSGQPISGVNVSYGYYSTTTDSEGFYKFIVPLGTEKMVFSKSGYIDVKYDSVESKINTTTQRDAVMSKKLNSNQYRAVLTWGSTPADLDSHLEGPGYHVYYSSKTGTNAALDIDDTTSYGPETITFTINPTGTYSYYVHDYTNRDKSGSRALAGSGATVRVYCGSEQLAEVHVPGGTGLYWNVFTITNGEFNLTNKIH